MDDGGDGDLSVELPAFELDLLGVALQDERAADGHHQHDRQREHPQKALEEVVQRPELPPIGLRHRVSLLGHLRHQLRPGHPLPGPRVLLDVLAKDVFVVPHAEGRVVVVRARLGEQGLGLFRAQGDDGQHEHGHGRPGVDDHADDDGEALALRDGVEDLHVREQGEQEGVERPEQHEGEPRLVVRHLPEVDALVEHCLGRAVGAPPGQGLAFDLEALPLLAAQALAGGSHVAHVCSLCQGGTHA